MILWILGLILVGENAFLRFVRTIAICTAAEGRAIKIRWLFCMLSTPNYQMISTNLKINPDQERQMPRLALFPEGCEEVVNIHQRQVLSLKFIVHGFIVVVFHTLVF